MDIQIKELEKDVNLKTIRIGGYFMTDDDSIFQVIKRDKRKQFTRKIYLIARKNKKKNNWIDMRKQNIIYIWVYNFLICTRISIKIKEK